MITEEELEEKLSGFRGRNEDLEKIIRFNDADYPIMFYRTNLLVHSKRVFWITKDLIKYAEEFFGGRFDPDLALTLAYVHDDAEIITGDIQAHRERRMDDIQLSMAYINEVIAIDRLSQRFPGSVGKYRYKDLLLHMLRKDNVEAQLVSFADKIDGFGESLHELFSRNSMFIPPCTNYIEILSDFDNRFPLLRGLRDRYEDACIAFRYPSTLYPHLFKRCELPDNAYPHYQYWRKITIDNGGSRLLEEVKEQKTF